ncbi:MAG: hypothetical protein HOI95_07455 [Chromatiales bacterium]|nr:hypothetical protein [Chromatiales bacterium]
MLVLEDAHWINPTTHDLFRQTVARVRNVAVMVVITHRPAWASGFDDQPHVVSKGL